MKVSMIPDNSVKMIHASQDDVGRRWEFELYDEDGLIDVSSVEEQMIYPVYQGGTEQILPENTSTPTTSPILADIVYPDELREEQEFLYRECPSVEDGQARIKRIKGNTIKWNQLIDTSNLFSRLFRATKSISGRTATITDNRTSANTSFGGASYVGLIPKNHKLIVKVNIKNITVSSFQQIAIYVRNSSQGSASSNTTLATATGWKYGLLNVNADGGDEIGINVVTTSALTGTTDNVVFEDLQIFDLTAMGKDSYTIEQFEAWLNEFYPLPYYAYNPGELIPFMGENIKTIGFNQWDEEWERGKYTTDTGEKESDSYRIRNKNFISVFPDTEYCIARPIVSTTVLYYGFDKAFIGTGTITSNLFITPSNCGYVCFYIGSSSNPITTYGNNICINISDPDRNGQYESYKESIVNLPTLSYFSDGMKSAGSVYDELTENKAVQRVEEVDLGSLNWTYNQTAQCFYCADDIGAYQGQGVSCECAKYTPIANVSDISFLADKEICFRSLDDQARRLYLKDLNYNTVYNLVTALSGVMLYFRLATPVETTITTAFLVSQNQEIPMSVEDDKLVAYSTAEVTEKSGFHDAKIKLSDDGVAYSAKFTLHVERKP